MSQLSRRELIGGATLVGGWLALGGDLATAQSVGAAQPAAADAGGPYELPALPYDYADLEPHIDAQTMKLHHDIHHAGYVRGANKALAELQQIRQKGGDAIQRVGAVSNELSFHLSGHLLHSVFWANMKKEGGGQPASDGQIGKLLDRDFGSFDAFRAHFAAAAGQVQGSGWGLLLFEPLAQRLLVLSAEKHQNHTAWGAVPLLVLDVWEHAYYLKYQNKRSDYITAFFELIDWQNVDQRLAAAMKPAK